METIKTINPIRAIKQAGLHGVTRTFVPLSFCNDRYSVEGHAHCGILRRHRAPDLDCTCGFYAWKVKGILGSSSSVPVLDVEFYGTVIEHERGYRAEYQRVLKLWIPNLYVRHWLDVDRRFSFNTEIAAFSDAPGGHPLSPERLDELRGLGQE